jgi:hypothetical protein
LGKTAVVARPDNAKAPMTSTPGSKDTEAGDTAAPRPDERLAQAHEEIKRADEQLSKLTEQLARMERDDAAPPAAVAAPPTAPVAEAVALPPPPAEKPLLRTLVALPIAACIIVAALVLHSTYGDGSKLIIARWAPERAATPVPSAETLPAQQPAAPAVQIASVEPVTLQAAPPPSLPPAETMVAQAAPPAEAPPAAATPLPATVPPAPDQTQLLQNVARDLANLERTIEQLRVNQQKMANDNAKAIGDLKASQDEMKRALAKVSDQPPARALAPPAAAASAVRKPERSRPQVRARPRYPYPQEWMYDDW